jgi:tagatose-1,6-bisphosphate aldolase non-catalytic subunit AgaZ/GatZ
MKAAEEVVATRAAKVAAVAMKAAEEAVMGKAVEEATTVMGPDSSDDGGPDIA